MTERALSILEHAASRNAASGRDHNVVGPGAPHAAPTLEVVSDHDPCDDHDGRVATGSATAGAGDGPEVRRHNRPEIAPPVHPARRGPALADIPQPIAGWDTDLEPQVAAPDARTATEIDTVLQLRQIAGLTAGTILTLEPGTYEFAEGEAPSAFRVEVDRHERTIIIPGDVESSIDTTPVTEPTPLGSGVLDVGSARFVIRHSRQMRRATEWLDLHHAVEQAPDPIPVPSDLPSDPPVEAATGRRRWRRHKGGSGHDSGATLDVRTWEFIEQIRQTRTEAAERERYHHPDPSELLIRARQRAPILGVRPPGHPLFATVGVIVADMPWMPDFDHVDAIPDWLGAHLRPLMSLPSIPIPADLTVGPLGIAGSRAAGRACARHVLASLYAMTTADITLHVATTDSEAWAWADEILDHRPARPTEGPLPIVVVDGPAGASRASVDDQEVLGGEIGLVVLADNVEDLPSYCGTVLQVDVDGAGLLTNHLGHIIVGTPVGVDSDTAADLARDLRAVMAGRGR